MKASDHHPTISLTGLTAIIIVISGLLILPIVISGLLILPIVISPMEEKTRPIDPVFKTEVDVRLNKANPEQGAVANIEYRVDQGWYQRWHAVNFFTTLGGELYEVHACVNDICDAEIFSPNDKKSWTIWQERFAEVRHQAETGLKKGTEEILQKREEEEKRKVQ